MPSQASNLVGQVLDGRYRIEARLGSGGMGDVYRATRILIGDTIAIKFLHAHLASNPQAAERFRHEAVTATKLRHRNVVALYDVGISAVHNVPYLLMELAEGLTLRQIINQQPILPLDFVVTVVAQVCAALEEAHRLGIVHRDIKPENIIANQTATGWHVKVLDFGIAKLYNEASSGLTQDGTAMGTPQYMSPEQCMGEMLDARSDIYSVGIVLYEMLCGTVPFKSAVASAIAVYQVQTAPPPPRAVNPNITPQVETVILRALSKQREERHQTAQALTRDLIQAATIAFKSGNLSGSTVFAPPDDKQSASHTLSEEILVEKEAVEPSAQDVSDSPIPKPTGEPEILPANSETAAFKNQPTRKETENASEISKNTSS
jgi:serine/threonine-protein kinase